MSGIATMLLLCMTLLQPPRVAAQAVLFDFDNAPSMTSLPISLTAGGITAHFSATGQGFSIQQANVLGFVPAGFSGQVIYPNSVYQADLLIGFDQTLTDFSIMYACEELACDDAATMRVTAFMNGLLVGTNTMTAQFPGTWPVDTLRCNFPLGFDSVVVHYDHRPPLCQDYGVIFMADNMKVTAFNPAAISNPRNLSGISIAPNPASGSTTIAFSLAEPGNVNVSLLDLSGRAVRNVFSGNMQAGDHHVNCDLSNPELPDGLYFVNIVGEGIVGRARLVVAR